MSSQLILKITHPFIILNLNSSVPPLLLHSSKRTTNLQPRKVIHLEFANTELLNGLEWAEKWNWKT